LEENFNISEKNIISVKLAKVHWVRKRLGFQEISSSSCRVLFSREEEGRVVLGQNSCYLASKFLWVFLVAAFSSIVAEFLFGFGFFLFFCGSFLGDGGGDRGGVDGAGVHFL
jgi:hypothetical protein